MKINFVTERDDNLYDFTSMQEILGVTKSKLNRELQKLPQKDFVKYKNQYLYNEMTLLLLMETILFQRLDKIEREHNELSESKTD
jgi:hypothetical protein